MADGRRQRRAPSLPGPDGRRLLRDRRRFRPPARGDPRRRGGRGACRGPVRGPHHPPPRRLRALAQPAGRVVRRRPGARTRPGAGSSTPAGPKGFGSVSTTPCRTGTTRTIRRGGTRTAPTHSSPTPGRSRPWERYGQYLRGQLTELLSDYGDIDELWLDGQWERTADLWDAEGLRELVRQLQPDCLVNDRLPGQGDFETPEQFVPATPPNIRGRRARR